MIDISKAATISGYMSQHELEWLANRAAKSNVIVEIGSWKGRSTRALADNTSGVIYAVDHWLGQLRDPVAAPTREILVRCGGDGSVIRREFDTNLSDHILVRKVVPVQWNSQNGIPPDLAILRQYRAADFLFIDGDHSYAGCKYDIQVWGKLLGRGGILSGHDYNTQPRHAGVRKCVDELFGDRVKLHGSIWYLEV